MRVIKKIKEMRELAAGLKQDARRIGFIPTMGFLHQGHLSLFQLAKKYCDLRIVSIFVNPIQFGPNEDFDRYPRDFKHDEKLCEKEGIDYIFYPAAEEMYQKDHKTYIITEDLAKKLCGITRPGHFQGVTTVVAKLFNIVKPEVVVMGQKDAQQCVIIKRMILDLNFDIKMMIAPTVREADGLAMSSRNRYLNSEERKNATVLYRSLQLARDLIMKGEICADQIKNQMTELIYQVPGASIEYLSIVDADNLESQKEIKGSTLITLAVYLGKTRLIDNILINANPA
jgi:pantoate--beta-alanine ligase